MGIAAFASGLYQLIIAIPDYQKIVILGAHILPVKTPKSVNFKKPVLRSLVVTLRSGMGSEKPPPIHRWGLGNQPPANHSGPFCA